MYRLERRFAPRIRVAEGIERYFRRGARLAVDGTKKPDPLQYRLDARDFAGKYLGTGNDGFRDFRRGISILPR